MQRSRSSRLHDAPNNFRKWQQHARASYSFLLHIIAYITRYKPGKLIHILGDTHIYEDHFDAVNQQLERVPVSFPQIEINAPHNLDIDDLTEDMFNIKNYKSYEKISASMIA